MITDQALLTIADKLGIAATEIFSIMVAGQKWQAISDILFGIGMLAGAFAAWISIFGGKQVNLSERKYTEAELKLFLLFLLLFVLFLISGAIVVPIMAPQYAALKEILTMVIQ